MNEIEIVRNDEPWFRCERSLLHGEGYRVSGSDLTRDESRAFRTVLTSLGFTGFPSK